MKQISNFTEARQLLSKFVPPEKQQPYNLDNMNKLVAALGNPQENYKVIHVAGTSGKTSTAYYVAALIGQTGRKIGLTVSPHVDEVNERLQIDLVPLPEVKYCQRLTEFLGLIAESGIKPTYFELLVAFAYWEFTNQQVDYAVVEVGLGGLLDGTNVIKRKDKVCVITDINLDHTEVLGNSLTEIATQKVGIIQPSNTVFAYKQNEEVDRVVELTCQNQAAKLYQIKAKSLKYSKLPLFQQRNWYLAKQVYDFIARRDNLAKLDNEQLSQAQKVKVPARMEVIMQQDRTIIIDGSHNAQKIKTLLESVKQQFTSQPIAALTAFVASEESRTKSALKQLTKSVDNIIITSFSGEQDTPKYSVEPAKVKQFCDELGYKHCRVVNSPVEAFHQLLQRPEPVLLVTGSFYLLNHIRPLIFK